MLFVENNDFVVPNICQLFHTIHNLHTCNLPQVPQVPQSARGADGACLSTKWRLEAEVRRLDFGEDTSALAQQAEVKHKNKDKQKNRG